VWLVGSVIFLLSLATAFTGYVVVSGNMSYWAALVILNLLSVIPLLGDEVVSWILSAATVTSWSVRRFTAIHFILALVSAAAFALHIILLHRTAPAKLNAEAPVNTESLWHVIVKDLSIFLLAVLPVFFESTKTLVHPDNWQAFSRLVTPAHIEPEIYFFVNIFSDKIT
jgi:ubiquinol-cytochrome c reductase cytochrome b subunit